MRLLSLLTDVWKNRVGAVPRPRFVTWAVTLRCNATCEACDSWRLPSQKELTEEEARAIFEGLGRLDAVRLTGGEPTLRPDVLALAEAVWRASRPSVLHLTTHGGFPDRVLAFAEGFSEPRRLRVLVSLDGLEETHDMSRGRAVRFAQVEETIRRLSGMRKRGVRVSVNHTIASRRSLLEAEALRARFAPLGVDVQPVLAYSSSATYGLSLQGKVAEHLLPRDGYPLHPALDREEALSFVRRTLGDLSFLRDAPTRFAKRYYLRGLAARLSGVRDACPRPRCVALRSHLRLLPDGSVPLCQFNGQRIGRMPSQPFEELWGSEVAAVARAWVDGCRGCWAECEVVPNALYSGDLLLSSIGRRGAGQRERPLRLRQGRRT